MSFIDMGIRLVGCGFCLVDWRFLFRLGHAFCVATSRSGLAARDCSEFRQE